MQMMFSVFLIGAGATAVMDLWCMVRERLGVPRPDYGLVGRWLGHMPRGRFRHAAIKAAAPVRAERLIGWVAHYLIGVAFAALLLGLFGESWLQWPTLWPALAVGLATVVAPFLLMQPGMGAGLAGRLTPHPEQARRQSLLTHAVFGLGLYAAAWLNYFLCVL